VLAVQAAQIDQMSGGRFELGLGAGWFAQEHEAHGIPFPPLGERFDVLEDHLAIITGMWATPDGDTFSYTGKRVSVTDAPGLPKPVQSPLPLIVGGGGTNRTPRLAARYATEFNRAFASVENFAERCAAVRAQCDAIGRDPSSLRYTAALVVAVGEDEATFRRRAQAIRRELDEIRANGAAGTVPEAAAQIRSFCAAGAQRIYLQLLDLHDLDHLELIATEVIPAV
jgi:alkanesulfonate monooxygenase SsuD/methylene tetrahydromethanopterin reductase-like flavin-dependent oxidoreductase (luciferase family)